MKLSKPEVESISIEYLRLKNIANRSEKDLANFKQYQEYAFNQLNYLVYQKAAKYKKFSNYIDLVQDGFEGLMMAFRTFNPSKGSFVWWANKYVNTRISRAASTHSTIRFPIKKAKEIQPIKVNKIPNKIDDKESLQIFVEKNEIKEKINRIILTLSPIHRSVVDMTYGLNGIKESSVNVMVDELNLSQKEYRKLLKEAQKKIKESLRNFV
jgi:RNA polymerase sigma factor (sigma-70 family)